MKQRKSVNRSAPLRGAKTTCTAPLVLVLALGWLGACGDGGGMLPNSETGTTCMDGEDNDQDNQIDCADSDCADEAHCTGEGCGNGTCDPEEDHTQCPDDCEAGCGNGDCDPWENTTACPIDCGEGGCGDGVVESAEQCDGFDLDGQTCASLGLGFDGGILSCETASCLFDTTGCTTSANCGNDVVEGTEQCDGFDLDGQTCTSIGLGFDGGILSCETTSCLLDSTGCTISANCGNGVVEGTEQCDGFNLNGQTCTSLGLGFGGGGLSCNTACLYDTTGCTTTADCGNGIREGLEECDGADLSGVTCVDLGYAGGALVCTAACTRETAGCSLIAEDCTNGVDDDSDGAIDCNDLDCASNPACGGSSEICTNGVDDDQDGLIDCDDQIDCSSDPVCQITAEICDNGIDDDGVNGCDCNDVNGCIFDLTCLLAPSTETNCSDGLDEDHDCEVDCGDSDCEGQPCSGGTCLGGVCQ